MSKTKEPPRRINSFATSPGTTDFQPKIAPLPKPSKEDIDKIAQETGFVSRQPQASKVTGAPRRYKTGRNQQLNLKVTDDTQKRFYAIADNLGLPLGEVFQRAVKALEDTIKISGSY